MVDVPRIKHYSLKPKRAKASSYRYANKVCNECGSSIIIDNVGNYKCSGDKLKFWTNEIKKFKLMNEENQKKYLNTLSDKGRFMEYLLMGNITCSYNSKLFSVTPTYTTEIHDPIAVAARQRLLGRELTEEELEKIPLINFPEEA